MAPGTRYSTSNSSANDPDMQDLLASLFGQAGGSYPGGSTYGGYDTFGAPRGPRKGADVQARDEPVVPRRRGRLRP